MQIRYIAGKDISARNISVRKGEELPEAWRSAPLVRALRAQFGQDAVATLAGKGERDPVLVAPSAAPEPEQAQKQVQEKPRRRGRR